MTTYVFPGIAPNVVDTGILSNSKSFESPLSKFVQTAARDGTRLALSQRFSDLVGAERRIMQAFLARMNGQENRALIYDHTYHGARGALGGTPVVDGANQKGKSISIRDMTADVVGIFRAGDQIAFLNANGNYELKFVLSDADSDSNGDVSLDIYPEIHHSPADGAEIVTTNPAGTFMLASPDISWSNRPDGNALNPIHSDFNVQWVEDIA